jgi:hypothetical protein
LSHGLGLDIVSNGEVSCHPGKQIIAEFKRKKRDIERKEEEERERTESKGTVRVPIFVKSQNSKLHQTNNC